MEHLKEADGIGKLDVNGKISETPYHLKAVKDDEAYRVEITVSAPRDWLLQRGFQQNATLVSQAGHRISLHSDSELDVGDNVSVVLTSEQDRCASQREMSEKYPELHS